MRHYYEHLKGNPTSPIPLRQSLPGQGRLQSAGRLTGQPMSDGLRRCSRDRDQHCRIRHDDERPHADRRAEGRQVCPDRRVYRYSGGKTEKEALKRCRIRPDGNESVAVYTVTSFFVFSPIFSYSFQVCRFCCETARSVSSAAQYTSYPKQDISDKLQDGRSMQLTEYCRH